MNSLRGRPGGGVGDRHRPGDPYRRATADLELLHQVEESRTRSEVEGVGLGPVIAQGLVEADGGRIWMEQGLAFE